MEDILIEKVKEIPTRTKNALKAVEVFRVSDLGRLSFTDLKMLYGIGMKGRDGIINFCKKNAIKLNKTNYLTT